MGRFAGGRGEDYGNPFCKLASAARTWQVSELAAELAIRSYIAERFMMFCELDVETSVKNPLDRRSFLRCALASGAALGIGGVMKPAAAMPATSASGDDARYISKTNRTKNRT